MFSGPADDGPPWLLDTARQLGDHEALLAIGGSPPRTAQGTANAPRLAPAATDEEPMWVLSLLVNIEHGPAGALPEVTYMRCRNS